MKRAFSLLVLTLFLITVMLLISSCRVTDDERDSDTEMSHDGDQDTEDTVIDDRPDANDSQSNSDGDQSDSSGNTDDEIQGGNTEEETDSKRCEHTYSSEILKTATCAEEGVVEFTCTLCGDNYQVSVPILEHTRVTDPRVAPTCEKAGLTEGEHCSVCNYIIVKQEAIPKSDHTPTSAVTENNKEPTCETDGSYELVIYCNECKGELSRETVTVTSQGHSYVHHEAKANNCIESGFNEYDSCSECDSTTYSEIPPDPYAHTVERGACKYCNTPSSTDGLEFSPNPDGKSYTLVGIGECTESEIVVGLYEGKSVVSVGEWAFFYQPAITSVSLYDTVTSIGSYAFYGCENLEDVKLSSKLKVISLCAFNYCPSVREIVIPEGVEAICEGAFASCENLEKITLPNTLFTIENEAFMDCSSLKYVLYHGREEEFDSISIGRENDCLKDAEMIYRE